MGKNSCIGILNALPEDVLFQIYSIKNVFEFKINSPNSPSPVANRIFFSIHEEEYLKKPKTNWEHMYLEEKSRMIKTISEVNNTPYDRKACINVQQFLNLKCMRNCMKSAVKTAPFKTRMKVSSWSYPQLDIYFKKGSRDIYDIMKQSCKMNECFEVYYNYQLQYPNTNLANICALPFMRSPNSHMVYNHNGYWDKHSLSSQLYKDINGNIDWFDEKYKHQYILENNARIRFCSLFNSLQNENPKDWRSSIYYVIEMAKHLQDETMGCDSYLYNNDYRALGKLQKSFSLKEGIKYVIGALGQNGMFSPSYHKEKKIGLIFSRHLNRPYNKHFFSGKRLEYLIEGLKTGEEIGDSFVINTSDILKSIYEHHDNMAWDKRCKVPTYLNYIDNCVNEC